MSTTIKVDLVVRDELKVLADLAGRTLGEEIRYLVAQERRRRLGEWEASVKAKPVDEEYLTEFAAWEAID